MHLDIGYWLSQLNLSQYRGLFTDYNGVEELLDLDESALKQMGVKNSSHRAKLASSLVLLRAKYKSSASRRRPRNSDDLMRHSTAFSQTSGSQTTLNTLLNEVQLSRSAVQLPLTMQEEESELRRQLEWELSQDAGRLESHAWYHGPISRGHSEGLLKKDGDFLVRDSSSGQPGDLVLSCMWKGTPLHFIINKIIDKPNTVYESIKYRIEDEPFDSVSHLITSYVGGNRPVSMATNARISAPVNRVLPLSHYAERFGTMSSSAYNHYMSRSFSPRQSPPHLDLRAQSASPPQQNVKTPKTPQYSTRSLPRISSGGYRIVRMPSESSQLGSIPTDTVDAGSVPVPPPKPSRNSLILQRTDPDPVTSESQDPITSGTLDPVAPTSPEAINPEDQEPVTQETCGTVTEETQEPVTPTPTVPVTQETEEPYYDVPSSKPVESLTLPRRKNRSVPAVLIPGNRRSCDFEIESTFSRRISECEDNDKTPTIQDSGSASVFLLPEELQLSAFDTENFQTLLLPVPENKPLDTSALRAITLLFEEHSPKSMALHLLHADLDVLGGHFELPNTCFRKRRNFSFGISSGIELCTLPQGEQIRQDLLERTMCLKLFVVLTILTCSSNAEDRATILDYWIQIAVESKTALGNMYSFAGLMLALTMPQIQRLDKTWSILRQKFTNSAYVFEASFRPMMKSARDGINPHAPNTTIPDLHSAVLLWKASLDSFLSGGFSVPELDLQLNDSGPDLGIEVFGNHLNLVRSWSINLPLYLRNSHNVLSNFQFDELLLDMFSTEFHAKLLWGSRGASAEAPQRYFKLEQVLRILSERCEPNST